MTQPAIDLHVRRTRAVFRAEGVGSLLRPAELRAAFESLYEQHRTPALALLSEEERAAHERLERLADEACADAVQRQIEIGLDVITDGEMRRPMFTHSFVDAVAGVEQNPHDLDFVDDQGRVLAPPTDPLFARRVEKIGNPAAREVEFVRSLTDHPLKVTFPAPSYWYYDSAEIAEGAYRDRDELVEHIIEIQRELVIEAIGAGANAVQFDFPVYPMLVHKDADAMLAKIGETAESLLEKAIAVDNAILEGLPAHVTTATHLCRGNYRSLWWLEGKLDAIAEQMFNSLRHDRLLIEWEDVEREGDYRPLRFVPKGRPVIVMGVVSTKVPEVESEDEVVRRLEDAAQFVDLDQLAISPQCGFASCWEGNDIAEEIQWRKLEVVAGVADRLWATP